VQKHKQTLTLPCVCLKCGELVHLHLIEAQPNLLEIGNNQDETKKLLEEHEQLLAKLKVISAVPMQNTISFYLNSPPVVKIKFVHMSMVFLMWFRRRTLAQNEPLV